MDNSDVGRAKDSEVLGLPELIGLSMLATADPKWQLPPGLRLRCEMTALRLQVLSCT